MLHEPIVNNLYPRPVATHRTIFNATFRCSNMLQVSESDSKTSDIIARILLKLVRVTPRR